VQKSEMKNHAVGQHSQTGRQNPWLSTVGCRDEVKCAPEEGLNSHPAYQAGGPGWSERADQRGHNPVRQNIGQRMSHGQTGNSAALYLTGEPGVIQVTGKVAGLDV